MDLYDEELLKFWAALEQHQVEYILVGGYAVNLHGYQRFTGDLDIWLNDTLENRKKLRNVFIACDMGNFPMIETMQFVPGWTEFYLNNSLKLDIMTEMKGLEDFKFHECYEMAFVAEIDDIKIPFLHLSQLITNKRVVDRPKDRDDVTALEQIQQIHDQENDRNNDPEPPSFSR